MAHVQAFLFWLILLSSLYIELALVCCMNPDNVHCFGTIFPNLNYVLPQSVPPARYIFNPTNTEVAQLSTTWWRSVGAAPGIHPGIHPDGEQPKTALWLWVCEITWYLYTRGVRGRMQAKQRWFKVTRELCHEWFHHFRHHVHDGHLTGEFATDIWRLYCFIGW